MVRVRLNRRETQVEGCISLSSLVGEVELQPVKSFVAKSSPARNSQFVSVLSGILRAVGAPSGAEGAGGPSASEAKTLLFPLHHLPLLLSLESSLGPASNPQHYRYRYDRPDLTASDQTIAISDHNSEPHTGRCLSLVPRLHCRQSRTCLQDKEAVASAALSLRLSRSSVPTCILSLRECALS